MSECMVAEVKPWGYFCVQSAPFLRSRTHTGWLLYLSSVNIMPLAVGFVCISMHQTHVGQWTKGKKKNALILLPSFSAQEESITCHSSFFLGVMMYFPNINFFSI